MLEISSQCLLLLCVVDYQEKVSESWLLSGWRAVEFVLSHLKDLLSYIHTHCTSQTLNSRGPCIVKTPRSEAHPLWRAMCIGEAEGLLLHNDFHASYFQILIFFSWKDSVNLTLKEEEVMKSTLNWHHCLWDLHQLCELDVICFILGIWGHNDKTKPNKSLKKYV